MPIIKQKRIYREDLKANSNVLYVFGDNLERVGMGGQAGEMRGEPNAVGIPTKRKPSMDDDAFFSDEEDHYKIWSYFHEEFQRLVEHLEKGGTVILPLDGIGTGLSELPTRAPKIHKGLELMFNDLERTFNQWK